MRGGARLWPIRLRPTCFSELGQFDFGQFELGQFDLGQTNFSLNWWFSLLGAPKGGRPKISRFFPHLPPPFRSLCVSLSVFVEFWWCLKRRCFHLHTVCTTTTKPNLETNTHTTHTTHNKSNLIWPKSVRPKSTMTSKVPWRDYHSLACPSPWSRVFKHRSSWFRSSEPLLLFSLTCRCGRPLDSRGHHRAASVGRSVGAPRIFAGERSLSVLAGGSWSGHNKRSSVVDGLPLFRGAQVAIDTTMVSPVRSDGTAVRTSQRSSRARSTSANFDLGHGLFLLRPVLLRPGAT